MFGADTTGRRVTAAWIALLACAALLVAGCSDDHGGAPAEGDASAVEAPDGATPSTATDAQPDASTATPSRGSLRVVAAAALRTAEDGSRAMFTVRLGSRPTGSVVVPLASSNEAETKVEPTGLTFTPDDWATPKTVTLVGQGDEVADGDQTIAIGIGPSSSADPSYHGVSAQPLKVTNADDDTAGIEVSALSPSAKTTEAGGQAWFTVRLRSRPTADVSLALASSKPAEGTADTASIVFTTITWSQPQKVTVTGKDDPVADGDQGYEITLAKAQSADPTYAAIDPTDIALTNQDDDVPTFLVSSPAPASQTTEGGGAATFTVRLGSKPSANVTLPISSNNPAEGTADVTELVFTPSSYDQPRTVTVTGKDDASDDGDQPYAIVLGAATSDDAAYAGLDPPDVPLTNKNDDVAGIVVSAPGPSTLTTEAGGKITFTVRLGSRPTADVTIGVTSSKPAEGQADVAQLVFTTASWSTPQTVTVTGQDDAIADGDVGYAIVLAKATSADAKYAAIDPDDVALSNVDDDSPGITVGAPLPGTQTSEGGAKVAVSVVLQTQPTASVTIPVSVSKPAEAAADVTELVFTTADWNVARTITVTGKDDTIHDGDQGYSLILGKPTSGDAAYAAIDPADVALSNVDDDTAGFTTSAPVPSAKTTEGGGQISFTIKLQSEPTASVTVPVSSSKPGEATADVTELVFTTGNWNVAQAVTVTGKDDTIDDGDQAYAIVLGKPTSGDALYAAIDPDDVALTNQDDDAAAILVGAPQPSASTTEAGGKVAFTVVLQSQPTADVTIGVSSSRPAEGQADVTKLVFTSADWSTPQTVTVTGQDDAIDDGDVAYAIVLAKASSADAQYAAIDPDDVALTNTDNDATTVLVGTPAPGGQTTEAGAQVTVSVVLASQPAASVTIPVSVSKATEASVDVTELVFTTADWSVPQTITVTGKDEAIDDGDQAYSLVLGQPTSADALYAALDPADVALTNIDDDTAGFTVSAPAPTNKTSDAGGQITFTVKLTSEPLADVTIPISSSKPAEGAPDKTELVFTAGDWTIAQTITVTGQADGVVDGNQDYSIVLPKPTSADALYAALDPPDVALTELDACPFLQFTSADARASMPQTADWALDAADWTIELWLKVLPGAQSGYVWATNEESAAHDIRVFYDAALGKVLLHTNLELCPCGPGTGNPYLYSAPVSDGAWHHVAGVRAAGTATIYTDGAPGETDAITSVLTPSSNAAFGRPNGYPGDTAPVDVRLGALRFSAGARYAGAFAPAKQWTTDASTLGLYTSRLVPTTALITDEAGGDNSAVVSSGITIGTDPALCQ